MLRFLVTRPSPQAEAWVARLRGAGIDAVALPLLAFTDPPDTDALERARATLPSRDRVVFVSPTAAARFLAPEGRPTVAWPPGLPAAAPGEGTASAMRDAGVPAEAITAPDAAAGRFDAEALWATLSPDGTRRFDGERVLVVRGTEGRDWLAERFAEAGAAVETVFAYQRSDAALDADARRRVAAAVAEPARHAWLVASASAVDALLRAVAGGGGDAGTAGAVFAAATAVATHPRIARHARDAGFGRVLQADAGFDAVLRCMRCIESPAT